MWKGKIDNSQQLLVVEQQHNKGHKSRPKSSTYIEALGKYWLYCDPDRAYTFSEASFTENWITTEVQTPSAPPQEMKIFLRVIKTVSLTVDRSDSIHDVKQKFQAAEGTATNVQELFFAGEHLKDANALAHYNISEGCILNMFISSDDLLPLDIKNTTSGKTIKLQMKNRNTVLSLKKAIQDKEQIPVDRQSLVYLGKTLEDQHTLGAYNVKKNSTVHIFLRPCDHLNVCIKMPCGRSFAMEAKSWYSVRDMKTLVETTGDVSSENHNLQFDGKDLDDSKTLNDYKICNGSSLWLVPKTSAPYIMVKTCNGKTMTVEVQKDDTVEVLMGKLQTKTGIPSSNFFLTYSGKKLEGERTVESYSFLKDSILVMNYRCAHLENLINDRISGTSILNS